MDPESVMLKWSQMEKDKYCLISLICGIFLKNDKNELTDRENRLVIARGGE